MVNTSLPCTRTGLLMTYGPFDPRVLGRVPGQSRTAGLPAIAGFIDIENLREILDRKLDGRSFCSIKALKAVARAAWRGIHLTTCQQLVDGMPHRLQKVKDRQGGHIECNIYS